MRAHHVLLLTLLLVAASDLDLPPFLPPPRVEPQRLPEVPRAELPPLSPRPPVFLGEVLPVSRRIAYVVDFSSSMTPSRWRRAKDEVALSLRNLPDGVSFVLMTYDCLVYPCPSEQPDEAIAWLESRPNPWERGSATGTAQAVVYALQTGADLVVLLSDGEPGGCGLTRTGVDPRPAHLRLIREANTVPTPIWTFCLQGDQPAQRFCQTVAGDSKGSYTYVP